MNHSILIYYFNIHHYYYIYHHTTTTNNKITTSNVHNNYHTKNKMTRRSLTYAAYRSRDVDGTRYFYCRVGCGKLEMEKKKNATTMQSQLQRKLSLQTSIKELTIKIYIPFMIIGTVYQGGTLSCHYS